MPWLGWSGIGLEYVSKNQDGFRGFCAETIRGVQDAIDDLEEQGRGVGRRVVLPASVTCSRAL